MSSEPAAAQGHPIEPNPAQGQSLVRTDAVQGQAAPVWPESAEVPPLPVQLDVCVPLTSFRVQDLLNLKKGTVLKTQWPVTEDLPLWSGKVQLVWTEFEVVDQKLAVRVTRLF